MTAKIIKSDDVNVTLGYANGTFEVIPRAHLQLGQFVQDGTVLEVYQNGTERVYAIARNANAGGFGGRIVTEVQGTHAVNKVAYILCALFLGGFGVHKFISGKWVLGIIYLLFFWTFIPAMVAVVEAIVAATKTPDMYGNIEM